MLGYDEQLQKIENWAKEMTEGRDASHAIEHFRRVRAFTVRILEDLRDDVVRISDFDGYLVAETAALVHDVFDHKYVSDNASGLEQMKEFLEWAFTFRYQRQETFNFNVYRLLSLPITLLKNKNKPMTRDRLS